MPAGTSTPGRIHNYMEVEAVIFQDKVKEIFICNSKERKHKTGVLTVLDKYFEILNDN